VGGGSESGVGTDSEGRDAEEAGLEGVGGGDDADVVRGGFKRKNRRKSRVGSKEVLVSRVL
jgi:hypothetical protein